MGADMFECDVAKSTDGVLYAIHDGYEMRLLHKRKNIKTLDSKTIDKLRYYNSIGNPTDQPVQRLEEILEHFQYGELFNIDRAWSILPELHEVLQRFPHVLSQAVIKTPVKPQYLDFFRDCPAKYMYMPICRTKEALEEALSRDDINLTGVELIASSPEHPLFDTQLIRRLKDRGLFVWINAITLSNREKHILSAGYDDDLALRQGPDAAWGKLIERGFNVIQTDWPAQLRRFRDQYHRP
jgi:glycerophosphoryl diester phosphodiesterase